MTQKLRPQNGFVHRLIWQSMMIAVVSIALALLLNILRHDPLTLPGNWSDEARLSLESGKNLIISIDDAKVMFEDKRAVFLDARPRSEFDLGHIPEARSLPWDSFDEMVEKALSDIDERTTLITYCDGPTCNLSHDLAMALIDMGYRQVKVLVNGWTVWRENRLPTESSTRINNQNKSINRSMDKPVLTSNGGPPPKHPADGGRLHPEIWRQVLRAQLI